MGRSSCGLEIITMAAHDATR